jgi:hypothetical protein
MIVGPGRRPIVDPPGKGSQSSFKENAIIAGVLGVVALFFLSGLAGIVFELLLGIVLAAPLFALSTTWQTLAAIPASIGSIPLLEPILIGAATGLVIGWLRRVGAIRRGDSEDLISMFVGAEFWRPGFGRLLLHLAVHAVVGALVAAFLAQGGVLILGDPAYPIAAILGGAGGSGGPFDWYFAWFVVALVAIVVAIVATIVLDVIIVAIVKASFEGAVSALTEHGVTVLVLEWRGHHAGLVNRSAFRDRCAHGALTGAGVAVVLLLLRQ